MGSIDRCVIHHIEMRVSNGNKVVRDFVMKYGFSVIGERSRTQFDQWLLQADQCTFLITEMNKDAVQKFGIQELMQDPYVTPLNNGLNVDNRSDPFTPEVSVVCNVAVEVRDLEAYLEKVLKKDVVLMKPMQRVSNGTTEIKIATVKSILKNVVHSLIQTDGKGGHLLPGFESPSESSVALNLQRPLNVPITHVDHVTFVCELGRAASVVSWYEQSFGMKRFALDRNSEDGSLKVHSPSMGLRLNAFEYWKCSETGISFPGKNRLTFVIGESLPESGKCHIKTFLQLNKGAGLQHIGLHTSKIVSTIDGLRKNGVDFVEPPYTYYDEDYFREKVKDLGPALIEEVLDIQRQGLLIDSDEASDTKNRYLMQKFTQFVFDEDTFFLEIIQRKGATGFGSGNIMALWKAMETLQKLTTQS